MKAAVKEVNEKRVTVKKKKLWKRILSSWELYLLLLPGIVLTIIYKYWELMPDIYTRIKKYIPHLRLYIHMRMEIVIFHSIEIPEQI